MSGVASPVLDIRDYSLGYATGAGPFQALKQVSLAIARGRTLGLVGESGSGKTSLAWAVMRYLPANAVEGGGSLQLSGEDLRAKTPAEILNMRGRRIGMVFQDPTTSLNPTMMMGQQIAEVLIRHRKLAPRAAAEVAEGLLARTGIARPKDMMLRYPHQASGGEKQRVVIATAFACNPEIILFDEPTTALDVITARQIQDLFVELQEETGVAALYISHDLALVSRIAHDLAVIHRGEIVEQGAARAIFSGPGSEYARMLIASVPRPQVRLVSTVPPADAPATLALDKATIRYGERSLLDRLLGRSQEEVVGARDVTFAVRKGEILGVVGESGSGKSTIARAIAGLNPFAGSISLDGRTVHARGEIDRAYRRKVQIIFQNPDGSLNPRQRVGDIIARPLKLYGLARPGEIRQRVGDLLEQVRLPRDFAARYPHQLSGGEKQRVAIARAFAAEPRVVLCDEITSSLDVSVQASVARLLVDLQARTGATCLFITHDINLVRQLAHRIVVMRRGELVDLFPVEDCDAAGRHPYTRSLLDAVPVAAGS
ncbi:MAG: ABC transporter ATP-binding protein [Methylobacterium sp.]|jgi:peptide/nickel transport system ATP-binding protein|nr:ABC transporter ATP-binding protein [Methylobacterium sp.]MCA3610559.1 ABC transporter ATP-binding protein [Methylobacterium sp.]MCA3619030.1 ABC transporter ATP-binding protein [Methylobacterium sp.]MCA3619798.1 ABC transporter ATP-binding protein [Methylobacterium sp.]MCA3625556.1 ABC transporter ATP-binding protein [Methylobacterium sp.]